MRRCPTQQTRVPLFMIRGKCACFRAKTVEISGHLPSTEIPHSSQAGVEVSRPQEAHALSANARPRQLWRHHLGVCRFPPQAGLAIFTMFRPGLRSVSQPPGNRSLNEEKACNASVATADSSSLRSRVLLRADRLDSITLGPAAGWSVPRIPARASGTQDGPSFSELGSQDYHLPYEAI